MIGLILNDHSVSDENICTWTIEFVNLFKAAKECQAELKKILCSNEMANKIKTLIYDCGHLSRTQKSAVISLFASPYIQSEFENEISEGYISGNLVFIANNLPSDCGLVAWLKGFPLISSPISPFKEPIVGAVIFSGTEETEVFINNISDRQHITFHHDYLARLHAPELATTDILPENKKYYFQRHHGINLLNENRNRILACGYVTQLESAAFNSKVTRFVCRHYLHTDGHWYAHLVMYRTDEGYSYLARTTARNQYEAELISEELEKLYPF